MKKRRAHTTQHCEGDTEAEELYNEADNDSDSDSHVVYEPEPEVVTVHRKELKPVRPGPTQRSHRSEDSSAADGSYYVPSSDSGSEFDLAEGDDDGAEVMKWAIPSGRKRRAKKIKEMKWCDESRITAEEQLCSKMCFTDVYQFRRALRGLHIAQLRNFHYHRNSKERIILECKERKKQG
ncbi:hypothetical protein ACQ4PT_054195 [Festuca glaucescens]